MGKGDEAPSRKPAPVPNDEEPPEEEIVVKTPPTRTDKDEPLTDDYFKKVSEENPEVAIELPPRPKAAPAEREPAAKQQQQQQQQRPQQQKPQPEPPLDVIVVEVPSSTRGGEVGAAEGGQFASARVASRVASSEVNGDPPGPSLSMLPSTTARASSVPLLSCYVEPSSMLSTLLLGLLAGIVIGVLGERRRRRAFTDRTVVASTSSASGVAIGKASCELSISTSSTLRSAHTHPTGAAATKAEGTASTTSGGRGGSSGADLKTADIGFLGGLLGGLLGGIASAHHGAQQRVKKDTPSSPPPRPLTLNEARAQKMAAAAAAVAAGGVGGCIGGVVVGGGEGTPVCGGGLVRLSDQDLGMLEEMSAVSGTPARKLPLHDEDYWTSTAEMRSRPPPAAKATRGGSESGSEGAASGPSTSDAFGSVWSEFRPKCSPLVEPVAPKTMPRKPPSLAQIADEKRQQQQVVALKAGVKSMGSPLAASDDHTRSLQLEQERKLREREERRAATEEAERKAAVDAEVAEAALNARYRIRQPPK